MTTALGDVLDFELPTELEAHDPPEAGGVPRDGVRLMAASMDGAELLHLRASDLPSLLAPGDLLVVNTSATLPAALPALDPEGGALQLHLSTPTPPGVEPAGWVVELRLPRGASSLPFSGGAEDRELTLPGGGRATLVRRLVPGRDRLWVARLDLSEPLERYLERFGRPIRYGGASREWPIAAYQTVYAVEPGSAEMPSAGRPLTAELITALVAREVEVAPLVLHAGVSSPEEGEPPFPERFRVPASTARRVNAARAAGGRVIAVGTTVVRALETAADGDGVVHPAEGWTDLVVTRERGVRALDGLITGWHEPRASHLALLEAVAGRGLLEASYAAALAGGYRFHEFGDLHLILPARGGDQAGTRSSAGAAGSTYGTTRGKSRAPTRSTNPANARAMPEKTASVAVSPIAPER
jgi:S-adenosylmethionine:tRNA ribosyltransferase-isomerase